MCVGLVGRAFRPLAWSYSSLNPSALTVIVLNILVSLLIPRNDGVTSLICVRSTYIKLTLVCWSWSLLFCIIILKTNFIKLWPLSIAHETTTITSQTNYLWTIFYFAKYNTLTTVEFRVICRAVEVII